MIFLIIKFLNQIITRMNLKSYKNKILMKNKILILIGKTLMMKKLLRSMMAKIFMKVFMKMKLLMSSQNKNNQK